MTSRRKQAGTHDRDFVSRILIERQGRVAGEPGVRRVSTATGKQKCWIRVSPNLHGSPSDGNSDPQTEAEEGSRRNTKKPE